MVEDDDAFRITKTGVFHREREDGKTACGRKIINKYDDGDFLFDEGCFICFDEVYQEAFSGDDDTGEMKAARGRQFTESECGAGFWREWNRD